MLALATELPILAAASSPGGDESGPAWALGLGKRSKAAPRADMPEIVLNAEITPTLCNMLSRLATCGQKISLVAQGKAHRTRKL